MTKSITFIAFRFVYKLLVDKWKNGNDTSDIKVLDLIEENDLWMADEWDHVGYCVVTCLDNPKLIESFNKGNVKVLDALLGKTIKFSNSTVEPELIKELLPLIIERHFT